MAYRSNAVTISAADGLGIVSGTFVIKDLSITNGQDPDGRNYVGQVHTLENGEFTFSVGRSASESVASWFNSKISGYNDPSVNGDRTTFGLITEDGTNDIYMIGLWSPSEGVTFADYAYLYQLNTETWTIGEALQQIHMVSVGGMAGMMGVHFRYGANVYVADDGTLTLSATERNSVLGSSLATNDWIPAIVN